MGNIFGKEQVTLVDDRSSVHKAVDKVRGYTVPAGLAGLWFWLIPRPEVLHSTDSVAKVIKRSILQRGGCRTVCSAWSGLARVPATVVVPRSPAWRVQPVTPVAPRLLPF